MTGISDQILEVLDAAGVGKDKQFDALVAVLKILDAA